jgi:hypothetical protein
LPFFFAEKKEKIILNHFTYVNTCGINYCHPVKLI